MRERESERETCRQTARTHTHRHTQNNTIYTNTQQARLRNVPEIETQVRAHGANIINSTTHTHTHIHKHGSQQALTDRQIDRHTHTQTHSVELLLEQPKSRSSKLL